MKFLHTSDWHVGKTLKGRSRLDEQRDVLREIHRVAKAERVDAVLVAGDLYETSAPSAQAQRLVVQALLALRGLGCEVIAIAGNHDHAATFDAYRPVMLAAGIELVGTPRPAGDGGVVSFAARSTGERVNVAVLPFVSQRYAIRAAELLAGTPSDHVGKYDQQVRDIIASLKQGFGSDAVNVIMAHLTVTGGTFGGGERAAQSIFEYHVPAAAFGSDPHYVALGHLHRRQAVPAPCPVHYSGAPLPVDFGEQDNTSVVLVVEVSPSTPARITEVPISAGRRLRTVRGTVAELLARAEEFGEDYLRVYVREPGRAGLREEVQDGLPNALEIRIDAEFASAARVAAASGGGGGDRTPGELFAAFCAENVISDDRVGALFARLHDEETSG
ncbi:MAG TPA: exonuclease SbcCD subunit D [Pseudonocardiaceae bacterium]|nr:exonuclease SbcCD subunit D [Pseudonocardiaceae bacterium]